MLKHRATLSRRSATRGMGDQAAEYLRFDSCARVWSAPRLASRSLNGPVDSYRIRSQGCRKTPRDRARTQRFRVNQNAFGLVDFSGYAGELSVRRRLEARSGWRFCELTRDLLDSLANLCEGLSSGGRHSESACYSGGRRLPSTSAVDRRRQNN